MPLSPEEFADQEDNCLFRSIKVKNWDHVRELTGMLENQTKKRNDTTIATTEPQPPAWQLIKDTDIYDNTPLHAALGYQAPDDILLHLLNAYPDATRVHGANEWLPLHVAAMWGSSPDVMTALILAYPEGLDDRGEGGIKGRTPRHFQDRFPQNQALLAQTTEEWVARTQTLVRNRHEI